MKWDEELNLFQIGKESNEKTNYNGCMLNYPSQKRITAIFVDGISFLFRNIQFNSFIKRILDKIDEVLKDNPVPADSKHIIGEHGVYRIRIGDYRAIYRINYQENKIIIIKIDKRERVY